MKVIKELSEMIEDTIECAEKYIDTAIEWKADYPDAAKALATVSDSEMASVGVLHSSVAKVIADYRKENGEPPALMMAVYDYLHSKHINNAARVKAKQAMYKEEK